MGVEDLQNNCTLHSILRVLSQKNIGINSKEWIEEYEKLIAILYAVGNLTEQSVEKIIQKLDKIDSLEY